MYNLSQEFVLVMLEFFGDLKVYEGFVGVWLGKQKFWD